jgi:isocitrate dehydrogenase
VLSDTLQQPGESVTMNQQLIDDVLNQILQDAKDFDLTALEELIKNIPEDVLKAYLPEEVKA